jgi:hypothetical protein
MIIFINKTKIDLAAAKDLALHSNEKIGLYIETDFSAITDDSITIVDLTGNGEFQNVFAPSAITKTLLQCGLSDSVKTINFIISDVDVTQSISSYGNQVAYEFLKYGREISTYVSADQNFIQTCIIPPMNESKTWKVYGYAYDNLRSKIDKPYTSFTYEDFIKLSECKIIWEGNNFHEWLNDSYRLTDNRERYGKKVDFAAITPLPLTINKGSIISVEFPEIQKIMEEENELILLKEKQKQPKKKKDSIRTESASLPHKHALFSNPPSVEEKGNSPKKSLTGDDERKEAPFIKKQRI